MPSIIKVKFEGLSPVIQSRSHEQPKLNRELADAYEKRTWIYKAHVQGGFEKSAMTHEIREDWADLPVIIPGIAFKRSLDEVAKYLGRQVPGKGKATYTKHFESGVQCTGDIVIDGLKAGDLASQRIFANADGVRGSGKRVHRLFPLIPSGWTGSALFEIWDDLITEEVFMEHFILAGTLIGVGSFRVRNGGMCGRFRPTIASSKQFDLEAMIKNVA